MADRIIGMGDILTLVENVQDKIDEQEAKRQAKKMMQGKYDLEDMLASMEQINKMGSFACSITRFASLTLLQQINPSGAGRISSNHIFIFPPISGFPLCV